MAKRKVIADSEDEDEGEDELLLHVDGSERPEPEPLSPTDPDPLNHNQQSDVTDVTDPPFLANIYDDQQSLTVQQSHLIENIVRQSQRASASSGDVSLPSMKKRRRVDLSSGTDVTSPTSLSRTRKHDNLLTEAASEFTTPRKSAGQEWEIPSSPEDAPASRNPKCISSGEKTSSKNKRRRSRLMSSPVAAELFAAKEAIQQEPVEQIGVDDQEDGGLGAGATSTPAAKRMHYSHHDSALPDPTKIYVAQSNLTTMQKLEYQKVHVSINGYGAATGSLPHQKSSGATIAYPTPRGYSPVPPLPWEEPPTQPTSPRRNEVLNISSSPDMVGPDLETSMPNPDMNRVFPVKLRARKSTSNGKRKATQITEEDELGQDDILVRAGHDLPPEPYKPRATKRRSLAAGSKGVESNTSNFEDPPYEAVTQTHNPLESLAPALPDTDPPEPPPETPVKKRGRKKKQHVTETPQTETDIKEDSYPNQNSVTAPKVIEAELPSEQPKKKRGRPRKSVPSKSIEEPLVASRITSELPPIDLPQKDNNPDESASGTKKREDTEQKGECEKSVATAEAEETPSADTNRLPLKEVDSNFKPPSRSVSNEESPTKTRVELHDEKSTPKTQSKAAPKLPASQSKVTYRVGLSKRSRIAPLLKSIKK